MKAPLTIALAATSICAIKWRASRKVARMLHAEVRRLKADTLRLERMVNERDARIASLKEYNAELRGDLVEAKRAVKGVAA